MMGLNFKNLKCFKNYCRFEQSRGFSLLEMIIVASVLSLISLGAANMIIQSNKQVKSLQDRLAVNDTKASIQNSFASQQFCKCLVGGNTFNYSTRSWNSFPASIAAAMNSGCVKIGGDLLSVGAKVSATQFQTTAMKVINIAETVSGSGAFSSSLLIELKNTGAGLDIKPISVPFNFSVNMSDPANARRLTSCTSESLVPPSAPTVLRSQAGYDGLSGHDACKAAGKSCSHVINRCKTYLSLIHSFV